jgi:hypothetical protein
MSESERSASTTTEREVTSLQDLHLLELDLAAEDDEWSINSLAISETTPEIQSETMATNLPTTATSTSDVVITDFTFKKRATKQTASPAQVLQVLHKKGDRALMPEDELFALQDKITKDQLKKKFTSLPLALDDQDKLEDTYNLAVLIRTSRAHLTKSDCHDVFVALKIDKDDDSQVLASEWAFIWVRSNSVVKGT